MMATLKEQAVLLGPRKSLVGVITPGVEGAELPTVVILNSGIVHRVGANRMSVTMARALAAAGCPVLRFDLSGIGDSEPRPDGLAPLEAALADIKEALDSLEATRRTRRVVLVGLCSGADHSLFYAGSDPRIAGIVLLDPSLPTTLRHHLHHYRQRLTHVESWLNLVRGKNPFLRALRRRINRAVTRAPVPADERDADHPEVRAYLAAAYRRALRAGVQLMVVVTGERHYYREQLLDAFPGVPFGARLRLEYFGASDHMFTAPADSARLIAQIVDWVRRTPFAPAR
jgi:dienelactone hydrolase